MQKIIVPKMSIIVKKTLFTNDNIPDNIINIIILIKKEIKDKYPEFPIELLDLIVKYVSCDLVEDCKTMGINDSCAEN